MAAVPANTASGGVYRAGGVRPSGAAKDPRLRDCRNVIDAANDLRKSSGPAPNRKALAYDGVLRFGFEESWAQEEAFIEEVRWQKAHCDINEAGISEEERKHRKGNDEADAEAKKAAQQERDRFKDTVDLDPSGRRS